MMKKMLSFIAAFLVLGGALFADVTVKDLGDGNAEVTFLFKGAAKEVLLAGDFTDWQNGALAMTKTDNGFELKKTFPMATTLKYKFIVDGTWLFDAKSPDKTDDGFGGFNGVVDVAKLVAVEKAKASGDSSALEKLMASQTGLKFGTFTQVTARSNFITRNIADPAKKGFETDNVDIKAKSYWKLSGELLKNVPAYIELKAFDTTKTLYAVGPTGTVTTKIEDGLNDFATGMLFYPFNYLKGGTPEVGHFKVGVNTDYVNLETANNWAKPSKRSTVLWTTVTDSDSGAGYLQFTNGKAIQSFGDLKLDIGIVPNKTLSSLGLRTWVAGTYMDDYTVEIQWDSKSTAAEQLVTDYFDTFTGDLIAGAKGVFGPVTAKAQMLMPVSSTTVSKALAVKGEVTFTATMFGITANAGYYEPNASMLYGDNGGLSAGKFVVYANPYVSIVEGAKVGMEVTNTTTYEFKYADSNTTNLKPYVNLDLLKAFDLYNATVDAYAKMDLNLANGVASADQFKFNELGVHVALPELSSLDINYGLQMGTVKMFNTLIATVATKPGINVQAGLGLRTTNDKATQADKDKNELLAFSLGANYKVEAMKNGVVYAAFVYNMDPYEDDKDNLDMDGYRPDKGIDDMAGYARFRLGVKWDF
ncbi:MAG: glycogen-binding domain-containing protein [Spirochaetota bacterium]